VEILIPTSQQIALPLSPSLLLVLQRDHLVLHTTVRFPKLKRLKIGANIMLGSNYDDDEN
jgi:hypothetical protein